MKKQLVAICMALLLSCTAFAGCGSESAPPAAESAASLVVSSASTALPDGVYTADFTTDSSMFHVSEACDGKGTLTVKDGQMTLHVSLSSKKILNLYPGLAEDAQKDGAELLEPTVDTVTYSDGTTEEVNGFDVPVPALDTEFDLALVGEKGKWYDHKVMVSNAVEKTGSTLEDGTYAMELTFSGGSGKAQIQSPATVSVKDGKATATVQWNSPNYDYMIVSGEKYLPLNKDGDSVFAIPVSQFDRPIEVIGDTVAMSKPHEITYTLTFHSETATAVRS
ncbi:MAG: iron transporter [Oscillospiraceae bacterium]|nr:iron transporter [Oscillospiraceae bacterium]